MEAGGVATERNSGLPRSLVTEYIVGIRSPFGRSPLDYFLWGRLKGKVHVKRPGNLQHLTNRTLREARSIYQITN